MRLLALAALLATLPALAQDTVVLPPGHPDLSTEALALRHVALDVAIVPPMAHDLGTIAETVADGRTQRYFVDPATRSR